MTISKDWEVATWEGIPFACGGLEESGERLTHQLLSGEAPSTIRFVNAYTIALASKDAAYGRLLKSEGINFADGRPVAVAARLLGTREDVEQVRGPEFFECMLQVGADHGVRHFLLGTTSETLDLLEQAVAARFPKAIIAGAYAPPFAAPDEDEWTRQVDAAVSSRAHIVWVALGTPKQDFHAHEISRRAGLTCAGVGAAFLFTSGVVPPAPPLLTAVGLEWLYRLVREPQRLWRRYLFGNARFLAIVIRSRVRTKRRRAAGSH